jgi:hypothetical protein
MLQNLLDHGMLFKGEIHHRTHFGNAYYTILWVKKPTMIIWKLDKTLTWPKENTCLTLAG